MNPIVNTDQHTLHRSSTNTTGLCKCKFYPRHSRQHKVSRVINTSVAMSKVHKIVEKHVGSPRLLNLAQLKSIDAAMSTFPPAAARS